MADWITGATIDRLEALKELLRDQTHAMGDIQDGLERIEAKQELILSSLKTSTKSSQPLDLSALWANVYVRLILSGSLWGGGYLTLTEALKFAAK